MKRLVNYFAAFAAIVSLFACQKEKVAETISETISETHTVCFITGAADTKTTVEKVDNKAVYSWEESDLDNIHVFEDGVQGTINKDLCSVTATELKLNVTFAGAEGSPHTYTANLNGSVSNEQISNGKYDAGSDVLVAYPVTTTASESAPVEFSFKRVSTISKITIKDLTDDEIVTKVSISSNKQLAGTYTPDNNPANDGIWSENSSPIVISCNETVSDGQVVVYAVTCPITEAQLTITAETKEGKRFQKSSPEKAVTLVAGNVTGYSFAMNQIASQALPYIDDFDWQTSTSETNYNETTAPDFWISYSKAAPGKAVGVVKVGSGSANGYFETKYLDLSQDFHVIVSAKAYNVGDEAKIQLSIGEKDYSSSDALTNTTDFEEYVFNCDAATNCSSVKIGSSAKRLLFDRIEIAEGHVVQPARINIENQYLSLDVLSSGDNGTIPVTFDNTVSKEIHVYSDKEHNTELLNGWFSVVWNANNHDIDWEATANESTTDARKAYLVISAKNSNDEEVTKEVEISQDKKSAAGTVRYEYTISTSDFSGTGYSSTLSNITATAQSDPSKTIMVSHSKSDFGLQAGKLQFKKSSGYIYNTTDLGTIISVTLNGASGNDYTVYKGTAQNPLTTTDGGYFKIQNGSSTLTCTSITVVFDMGPKLDAPTGVSVAGNSEEKKIQVTWEDVPNATGYNVYNGDTKLNSNEIAPGTQSYDITNITFGQKYSIYVEAVADGYSSGKSTTSEITVNQIKLNTPAVNDPVPDADEKTITITWAGVEKADSYTVYNAGESVASGVTGCSYTFSEISYGQEYSIQIEAHSNNANIATSDKSTAKKITVADPSAKTFEVSTNSFSNVSASGDTKQITISADDDVEWEFANVSSGLTFTSADSNVEAEDDVVIGTGTATVNIIVSPNAAGERTLYFDVVTENANVSVKSYKVEIKQEAGVKDPEVIYSTGFENSGEHRASGNNSYLTNTYGKWHCSYTDIISNSDITGSYLSRSRVAKNTTNSPQLTSDNLISTSSTITSVEFKSKSPAAFTLTFEYSTDGGNSWIAASYTPDKDTSTKTHTVTLSSVSTSDFRIRFTFSVSKSTSSNRDGDIDDIVVNGYAN